MEKKLPDAFDFRCFVEYLEKYLTNLAKYKEYVWPHIIFQRRFDHEGQMWTKEKLIEFLKYLRPPCKIEYSKKPVAVAQHLYSCKNSTYIHGDI